MRCVNADDVSDLIAASQPFFPQTDDENEKPGRIQPGLVAAMAVKKPSIHRRIISPFLVSAGRLPG
jgi:hypothetical protein